MENVGAGGGETLTKLEKAQKIAEKVTSIGSIVCLSLFITVIVGALILSAVGIVFPIIGAVIASGVLLFLFPIGAAIANESLRYQIAHNKDS